jgi:hypothetical protein
METTLKSSAGHVHQQKDMVGEKTHSSFNENHVLHELKHYLPSQQALKDFIHHNSLHAFQHMKFYDAIFKVSKVFGYQVTLQLSEFRQLHKTDRVNNEVLEGLLHTENKGVSQLAGCKSGRKYPQVLVRTSQNVALLCGTKKRAGVPKPQAPACTRLCRSQVGRRVLSHGREQRSAELPHLPGLCPRRRIQRSTISAAHPWLEAARPAATLPHG